MTKINKRYFLASLFSVFAKKSFALNIFDDSVVRLSKICEGEQKNYTKIINNALAKYGLLYLDIRNEIPVENIIVPSGAAIIGQGSSITTIRQIKGVGGDAIFCGEKNSSRVALHGFSIAGSNNTGNGIVIDNRYSGNDIAKASKFGHQDVRNFVNDVFVFDFGGSGLISKGKGASFFSNIWIYNVGGNGVEINSFDSDWSGIDCGLCGLSGIYMGPYCANNRITNIKSWYTGMNKNNKESAGIYFDKSFRNNISNIEVQNHNNFGLFFNSTSNINFNSFIIEGPSNNKMENIGLKIIESRDMIFSGIIGDRGDFSSMTCGVQINSSANIMMNLIITKSEKIKLIDVIDCKKILCNLNGDVFNFN